MSRSKSLSTKISTTLYLPEGRLTCIVASLKFLFSDFRKVLTSYSTLFNLSTFKFNLLAINFEMYVLELQVSNNALNFTFVPLGPSITILKTGNRKLEQSSTPVLKQTLVMAVP